MASFSPFLPSWRVSGPHRDRRVTALARLRRPFIPRLEALEDRFCLSTLTVVNNADSGAGSLRDTIAVALAARYDRGRLATAGGKRTLIAGNFATTSNDDIFGVFNPNC
jgi:hypothetical protein